MSNTTKDFRVRPEGFEPTTLGFEGRSIDLVTQFVSDRLFRVRPRFGRLLMASNPSRSIPSGIGSMNLSQIRPTPRAG